MKKSKTYRGFDIIEFYDKNDQKCSIQKSSIATIDCIWIGLDSANPKVMASQAASVGVVTDQSTGWVEYPIPDDVLLSTRMHLTVSQVKELIPILQKFVETGEL